jgi:phage terminase large subunit-like protein
MNTEPDEPPPEFNYITVTRRDVTRGQLETAIYLWFHEADPVSIWFMQL